MHNNYTWFFAQSISENNWHFLKKETGYIYLSQSKKLKAKKPFQTLGVAMNPGEYLPFYTGVTDSPTGFRKDEKVKQMKRALKKIGLQLYVVIGNQGTESDCHDYENKIIDYFQCQPYGPLVNKNKGRSISNILKSIIKYNDTKTNLTKEDLEFTHTKEIPIINALAEVCLRIIIYAEKGLNKKDIRADSNATFDDNREKIIQAVKKEYKTIHGKNCPYDDTVIFRNFTATRKKFYKKNTDEINLSLSWW